MSVLACRFVYAFTITLEKWFVLFSSMITSFKEQSFEMLMIFFYQKSKRYVKAYTNSLLRCRLCLSTSHKRIALSIACKVGSEDYF